MIHPPGELIGTSRPAVAHHTAAHLLGSRASSSSIQPLPWFNLSPFSSPNLNIGALRAHYVPFLQEPVRRPCFPSLPERHVGGVTLEKCSMSTATLISATFNSNQLGDRTPTSRNGQLLDGLAQLFRSLLSLFPTTYSLIITSTSVKMADPAATTPSPQPDLSRNRLPTLFEVLSRRTLPPVDLFSFYIYMRDQQRSVDYLDFWWVLLPRSVTN